MPEDCASEYSRLRAPLQDSRPPLDKDDPEVIPLLVAMTSLRCKSYGIPCPDELAVRQMCGNIVPALVTSTSAASALAVFEATRGGRGGQWFVDMDGCGYFRAGGVMDEEEVRGGDVRTEWRRCVRGEIGVHACSPSPPAVEARKGQGPHVLRARPGRREEDRVKGRHGRVRGEVRAEYFFRANQRQDGSNGP